MNTGSPAVKAVSFLWGMGAVVTVLYLGLVTGCVQQPAAVDPAAMQTQMAVGVQATVNAQQSQLGMEATLQAQQATLVAQAAQATLFAQQMTQVAEQPAATPTPEVDSLATQVALSVQATADAAQAQFTPTPMPTDALPEPTAAPDFEAWMKEASILLYEDMVSELNTTRFIKSTLDYMGLDYEDVGDGKGDLKSMMLSGGPGGQGWDLIIVAAERKSGVSGEFFTYVNDALNMGSSVILEVWYLDRTAGGTASTLLARCGVEYERDWASVPQRYQVMYHLDPGHPLLNEPNTGLSFTKVTTYWSDTWNIGDLLRSAPGSDADFLVGTLADQKKRHVTLTSCLDGRLILQTFSTHSHTKDAMLPVWENYIHNALKARFQYLQEN